MLESVPADRLESRNGALTSDAAFFFMSPLPRHLPDCYQSGRVLFLTHHAVTGIKYISKFYSDGLYTEQAVQPRLDGEYKRVRMIVFLA